MTHLSTRGAHVACVACSVVVTATLIARGQVVEPNVRFRWAFAALPKGSTTWVPVRNGSSFSAGDRLKMFLKPEAPLFVYIVWQSPGGALDRLFPVSLAEPQVTASSEYFIPPASEWLALDEETGREIVHVLASATRQRSLENVLQAYAAAREGERADMARRVLAEMQTLRTRFFQEQTTAESPVDIGGTARGLGRSLADLAGMSVDISARNFYSRTIAIDHR